MDWDERFLRGDELHDYGPSPPLPQAIGGITPGSALDLPRHISHDSCLHALGGGRKPVPNWCSQEIV